jgi:hypothetical protein
MKKLITISLTVALLTVAANAAPMLVFQENDLGGGLTEYIFSLEAEPGDAPAVFATSTLVFSGNIQQQLFNGAIHAHNQTSATNFGIRETDTWLFDDWAPIAPGNTNMNSIDIFSGPLTGQDVILSVGGENLPLDVRQNLIRIAAIGPVTWAGGIAFAGADSQVSGSTAPTGFQGDAPGNPIMPTNSTPGVPEPRAEGGTTTVHEFTVTPEQLANDVAGLWYDPPQVPAYEYESSTHNFLAVAVANLQAGAYEVRIPNFSAAITAADGIKTFVELFGPINGVDISKFWIKGIDPTVDADDPIAFPTFLQFDNASEETVEFTMTGVPEPATMGLMLFGAIGMIARKKRRS